MADAIALALANRLPATAPVTAFRTLATLPGIRSGGGVSTDGSTIYVSHGVDAGSNLYSNLYVVSSAGTVTTPTGDSVTVAYCASVYFQGRHWVIGGQGASGITTSVRAYDPVANSWAAMPSLPAGATHTTATVAGGNIYQAGGTNNGAGTGASIACNRYNGTTWSAMASMPAARWRGALVPVGTRLFYVGGLDGNGNVANTGLIYDTISNTWSVGAALPFNDVSGDTTATAVGTKIYYTAAATVGQLGLTAVYDTVTGTWAASANTVPGHGAFAKLITTGTASINYVGGSGTSALDAQDTGAGIGYSVSVKAAQQYLAAADPLAYAAARRLPSTPPVATIATVATMGTPRQYPQSATDGSGRVVVMGGVSNTGAYLGSVERFDSSTGAWSTLASLPTTMAQGFGCTDSAGRVYCFAGYANGNTVSVNTFRLEPSTGTWSTLTAPSPNYPAAAGAYDSIRNVVYQVGGYATSFQTTVQVYNVAAGTWSSGTPLPVGRATASAVCDSTGRLYVAGGSGDASVQRFDPVTSTWAQLAGPPLTLGVMPGAVTDTAGRLYFGAGATASQVVRLDPATLTWTIVNLNLSASRNYAGWGRDALGRLIVAGGGNGGSTALSSVDAITPEPIYNPRTTKALAALIP